MKRFPIGDRAKGKRVLVVHMYEKREDIPKRLSKGLRNLWHCNKDWSLRAIGVTSCLYKLKILKFVPSFRSRFLCWTIPDGSRWMLDVIRNIFLIYPESSIQDPVSFHIKQWVSVAKKAREIKLQIPHRKLSNEKIDPSCGVEEVFLDLATIYITV